MTPSSLPSPESEKKSSLPSRGAVPHLPDGVTVGAKAARCAYSVCIGVGIDADYDRCIAPPNHPGPHLLQGAASDTGEWGGGRHVVFEVVEH